jgi:hypothetical protein
VSRDHVGLVEVAAFEFDLPRLSDNVGAPGAGRRKEVAHSAINSSTLATILKVSISDSKWRRRDPFTDSIQKGGGNMSRITESEIADIVIAYLEEKTSGRASIQELVREIPNRVTLSAEDLKPSPTRANEAIWEQQVRNITSHKNSPGSAIFEGRLVAIPGGLALPGSEEAA